jgi:hypothetical protein
MAECDDQSVRTAAAGRELRDSLFRIVGSCNDLRDNSEVG